MPTIKNSKRANPYSLWWDFASTANAAATTIIMRNFRIQQAFMRGDMTGGREASTMVSEKVAAAQDGYIAAAKSAGRSLRRGDHLGDAIAKATAAAIAPARKKARANAKRLTRKRKKK